MTDEIRQGREPARAPTPGRHRRTLVMAGVVLAFLAVIALVGVFRGQPAPKPTPSTSGSPATSSSAAKPLQLTGVRCAKLDGAELTVGFQVVNRGPGPVVLSEVSPSFPLGGLTPDLAAAPDVSSCPGPATDLPYLLDEGDRALVTLVLTATNPQCVGPLVVDIGVDYGSGDDNAYADTLHAFPDLGGFGLPSQC